MNLTDMITLVQLELQDSGVHYTNSGVSEAINEGYQLACLLTLCYERHSHPWNSTPVSGGQQLIPMPADCIAPIYVYDTIKGNRVHPVRMSELELHDTIWWTTSGSNYEYYSLFNPCWSSGVSTDQTSYSMLVYPTVTTTEMRLRMVYGAHPTTMTSTTDTPNIPSGQDNTLTNYATFMGLVRQRDNKLTELSKQYLTLFFDGVGSINSLMKGRYAGGRDFEPRPIEDLLERHMPVYGPKQQQERK